MVTTVHGLPVAFALTNVKTGEREVLIDLVALQPAMFHRPDGLILVVDKGYRDRDSETWLNDGGVTVVRPACRTEPARPGAGLLRAVRQSIEWSTTPSKANSILNNTVVAPSPGVAVRVLKRVLALTAAIWHNWHTGQPTMRSLLGYDH